MLLFLKIYFICLNVSQELDLLATSSFFSSFKRLFFLSLYLVSFSLEKMLLSIANPPLDSDLGLGMDLLDSAAKKGWARI